MSTVKQVALARIAAGESRNSVARNMGLAASTLYRWAAGSPSVPVSQRAYKRPDREPCSVDGCGRGKYAKQLCVMHYNRLKSSGSVGRAERSVRENGAGSINGDGYLVIRNPSHPLATSQGKLLVHRAVLYNALGAGPHPCHWCGVRLPWQGRSAAECINVDHLDFNRLNNSRENLVAACLHCNSKRTAS